MFSVILHIDETPAIAESPVASPAHSAAAPAESPVESPAEALLEIESQPASAVRSVLSMLCNR